MTMWQRMDTIYRGTKAPDTTTDDTSQYSATQHTTGTSLKYLIDLVAEQESEVAELFEEWDVDNDGIISKTEFCNAIISLGITSDFEEASRMFDLLDTDLSGELDYREFRAKLGRIRRLDSIGATVPIDIITECDMQTPVHVKMMGVLPILMPFIGVAMLFVFSQELHHVVITQTIDDEETFDHKAEAIGHIMMLPVIATVVAVMVSSSVTFGDKRSHAHIWLGVWTCATVLQFYCAIVIVADPVLVPYIKYYFRLSIALLTLAAFLHIMRTMDAICRRFVKVQDATSFAAAPIRKWIRLMKLFSTWKVREMDKVYSFDERSTAADVLYEMWHVLHTMGKVSVFAIFGIFYVQAASTAESKDPEFAWDKVILFLFVAVSTMVLFIGCQASSVQNLLQLATQKPFYLGEIVTVHCATNAAGHDFENTTGFVENITFSYVVIRDFSNKQCWISHHHWAGMSVTNWARRWTKQLKLHVVAKITTHPDTVQCLVRFIKKWVLTSPQISQTTYIKVAMVDIDPGYKIEIICYTKIGESKKKVRQQMLVAILRAARRLDITILPKSVGTLDHVDSYKWYDEKSGTGAPGDQPAPLGPETDVTSLDDLLPTGQGMRRMSFQCDHVPEAVSS